MSGSGDDDYGSDGFEASHSAATPVKGAGKQLTEAVVNAAKLVPPPRPMPPRASSAPPRRKPQADAASSSMMRAAPSTEAQMASVLRLSRPRTAQRQPTESTRRVRPATAPSRRRPHSVSQLTTRMAPQASQSRVQEIVDTCVKRVLAHAVLPPPPVRPRTRPTSASAAVEQQRWEYNETAEVDGMGVAARRRATPHGGKRPKSTGRVSTTELLKRLYEPLRKEQEARRERQEREAAEAIRVAQRTGVVRPPPRQEQRPRRASLRQPLRQVNAMRGPQGKKMAPGASGMRFSKERLFATNDGWPCRWPVDMLRLPCEYEGGTGRSASIARRLPSSPAADARSPLPLPFPARYSHRWRP